MRNILKKVHLGGAKKLTRFLMVFAFIPFHSLNAQEVAIKNNLLYDATLTPNLGLEMTTGKRQSIQVVYGLNTWSFNGKSPETKSQAKHWVVMPEYRWWTCTALNGLFFGVHAMGGEFNAGNLNMPQTGVFFKGENLMKNVKDSRYEGKFLGGGFTIGYQYILSKHWNFELEAGVGYNHVWYDKYPCSVCSKKLGTGNTNYVGVTKLGASFMYIF